MKISDFLSSIKGFGDRDVDVSASDAIKMCAITLIIRYYAAIESGGGSEHIRQAAKTFWNIQPNDMRDVLNEFILNKKDTTGLDFDIEKELKL